MSETINPTKKKDLHLIDPRSIIVDFSTNPRVYYGTPEEQKKLKESIRVNGVKDPLLITNTKEGPVLNHGFCRMKAVLELLAEGVDIAYVPCIPTARGYNEEQALLDHVTLNSGRPLTPMEKAGLYKKLINLQWTQKQIAEATGETQGAISNILKLADLPMRIQNYINEGLVSGSLVMHMLKHHKNDYQAVTLRLISAIERNDGSKQKVTEKTVAVQRVSKYHKRFSGSIEVLRERNVDAQKISKVEAIMEALETETAEELADKLLAIL